jgi:hypothetical protein
LEERKSVIEKQLRKIKGRNMEIVLRAVGGNEELIKYTVQLLNRKNPKGQAKKRGESLRPLKLQHALKYAYREWEFLREFWRQEYRKYNAKWAKKMVCDRWKFMWPSYSERDLENYVRSRKRELDKKRARFLALGRDP